MARNIKLSLLAGALVLFAAGLKAQTFTNLHSFATAGTNKTTGLITNVDGAYLYGRMALSGNTLYGVASGDDTNGLGGLFKMNTDGSGFSNFFAFGFIGGKPANGVNGSNPFGGLMLAGGKIYGTTRSGGSNFTGSVFAINTNGTGFTNLHIFSKLVSNTNTEGADPQAGLVVVGNMVYGTTYSGGTHGLGAVFAVNINGTGFTNLFNFAGTNGQNPQATLATDGNTLYGTTYTGGSAGNTNGTVFAINTDGTGFTNLHSFSSFTSIFPTNSDGARLQGGLVLSGGVLYGTATAGGPVGNGYGTIFAVSTNGTDFTNIFSFHATDGGGPASDLLLLGNTLYGTTVSGSGSNTAGTVYQINTDGTGFVHLYGFPLAGYSGSAYTNSAGEEPRAGLVLSGQTLFGVTPIGGTGGVGTVYGVTVSSIVVPLAVTTTSLPDGTHGVSYNQTLAATGGQAPYAWTNISGTLPGGLNLAADGTLTGTPTNNGAFNFTVQVTDASSNTATQALSIQVNPAEAIPPTLSFSAPKNGQLWSNALFTVTGTAKDNMAVASVLVSLNNGDWTPATLSNGGSNWTEQVTLVAGTNHISAYAVDTSGNLSTTTTVSMAYVQTTTLTVITNGDGTITPSDNGVLLQIGKSFTLTAKAATGFKFVNWTGSVTTTNPVLTFIMASNLTFTANFVDSTVPTITVTAPKAGQSVSNAVFTASGTAKDNVGVQSVSYQLNGGDWQPATTGNSWSNWTANLNLVPGTNKFSAYAMDAAGNLSITDTVSFFYVLNATLTVNTNGNGTVTPNDNGALLPIGRSFILTAKAATGFKFVNWTGSQTTTNPALTFLMASNLTFTANFVDITKPTLTVTAPKANQSVSNAVFTASGTAKDNVGVQSVVYQVNGGDWQPASTGNSWSNWTANLNLVAGTNKFSAYAMDAAGNLSVTDTVSFVYVQSAVLTVNTNGNGTVTPNDNGVLLQIGKSVTLTAKAATGFKFVNWTGSQTTTNPVLTFLMASNLTFTANFADATPPTVTLASPTGTTTTTSAEFQLAGKASDNVAVANVFFSVSGSDWTAAQTSNHWTNWTASAALVMGTNIIRVYAVDSSGLSSTTVTGIIVRTVGATIFPIASGSDINHPQAQVAFDGSNYLVGFQNHPNGPSNNSAVVTQFISPAGQLVGGVINVLDGGDPPCVAFDGTNYLVASASPSVQGVFMSPAGVVGNPGQLVQSTTVNNFGTMVYGGGVYFLEWSDDRNSPADIYGAMIAANGTVAASDFLIGSGGSQEEAGQGSAAFDGTNFLATWAGASGNFGVNGRLLSPAGGYVTDPFTIYTNNALPAGLALSCAAFDGSNYLVLFNAGIGAGSASGWHIFGRFVTPAGAVLTNQITITTDAGPQIVPGAAFDGTHYLITWNQGFNPLSSTATSGSIKGRFFDTSGNPTSAEFTMATPTSGQTALFAPVLFDGTQYFSAVGLGQWLSSSPNLKFTNGVISGVIVAP